LQGHTAIVGFCTVKGFQSKPWALPREVLEETREMRGCGATVRLRDLTYM